MGKRAAVGVLINRFVARSGTGVPRGYRVDGCGVLFNSSYVRTLRITSIFRRTNFRLVPSIITSTNTTNIVGGSAFSCVRSYFIQAIGRRVRRVSNVFLVLRNTDRIRNVNSNSRRVLTRVHGIMKPCLPVFIIYSPRNGLYGRCTRTAALVHDCHRSPRASDVTAVHGMTTVLYSFVGSHRGARSMCHGLPLVLNNRRDISNSRPIQSVGRCVSGLRRSPRVHDID